MKPFNECMQSSSNYANKNLEDKWNIITDLYDKNMKHRGLDKIPKLIHQIWIGGEVPQTLVDMADSVKAANPDYEYKLWLESDADSFQFETKKIYDAATNPGQKSDILRYAILKKYGGIYLDTDFIGVKSFDQLLHLDFFVGVSYDKEPTLFNGLIGAVPNHPVIIEANVFGEIRDGDGMDVIKTTGPWFLTKKLFKNIDKAGKIVVLPLTYFYPYPNFDKDKVKGNDYKKYITEETICIHLWDSRWN